MLRLLAPVRARVVLTADATRGGAGYIGDILDEAKRYAEHRSREGDDVKISKEDVRLAVQAKVSVCVRIVG